MSGAPNMRRLPGTVVCGPRIMNRSRAMTVFNAKIYKEVNHSWQKLN